MFFLDHIYHYCWMVDQIFRNWGVHCLFIFSVSNNSVIFYKWITLLLFSDNCCYKVDHCAHLESRSKKQNNLQGSRDLFTVSCKICNVSSKVNFSGTIFFKTLVKCNYITASHIYFMQQRANFLYVFFTYLKISDFSDLFCNELKVRATESLLGMINNTFSSAHCSTSRCFSTQDDI